LTSFLVSKFSSLYHLLKLSSAPCLILHMNILKSCGTFYGSSKDTSRYQDDPSLWLKKVKTEIQVYKTIKSKPDMDIPVAIVEPWLKGPALEWFEALGDSALDSWTEFETQFNSRFKSLISPAEYHDRLVKEQRADETLATYLNRLENIRSSMSKLGTSLPDSYLVDVAKRHIRPEFRPSVWPLTETTFKEFSMACQQLDRYHPVPAPPTGKEPPLPGNQDANTLAETMMQGLERLHLMMQENSRVQMEQLLKITDHPRPPPFQREREPCSNCHRMGHRTEQCWAPCRACNGQERPEHSYNNCPLRQRVQGQAQRDRNAGPRPQDLHFVEPWLDVEASPDLPQVEVLEKRLRAEPNQGNPSQKRIAIESLVGGPLKRNLARKLPPYQHISDTPVTAKDLINQVSVTLSLAQIVEISKRNFGAELRQALTIKREKPSEQPATRPLAQARPTAESMLSEGAGAPRTMAIANDEYQVMVILDSGAVENVISLQTAVDLGYDTLDTHTGGLTFVMADGNIAHPLGVIRDLKLTLGDRSFVIKAYVLKHDRYDILLGRRSLKDVGVSVDFKSDEWWLESADGSRDSLDISYETGQRDPSQETFLTLKELYKPHPVDTQLTPTQQEDLKRLLDQYPNTFIDSFVEMDGPSPFLEPYDIELEDSHPVKARPHRLARVEKEFVKRQLMDLERGGLARRQYEHWGAAVLLVPKGDTWRMVMDYRPFNQKYKLVEYSFPRIDETVEICAGAQFISHFDMFGGYAQNPVTERTQECTAITTPFGTYRLLGMWFGTKNSAQHHQQNMDRIFEPIVCNQRMAVFIDDFILPSKTFEEHLILLQEFLDLCVKYRLKLSKKKASIAQTSIVTLGYSISGQGIVPCQGKLDSIRNFPTPTSKEQVQSFLGLLNFYHQNVEKLALRAAPLAAISTLKAQFRWGEVQQRAFDDLRTTDIVELAFPDDTKPFHMFTDACQIGRGVVVVQWDDNQRYHIVAMYSQRHNPAEQALHITELECSAANFGFHKCRLLLLGRKVHLYTDSIALRYVFNKPTLSPKLTRWIINLMEFDIEIHHLPGRDNKIADILSRHPVGLPSENGVLPHYPSALYTMTSAAVDYEDSYLYIVEFLTTFEVPATISKQAKERLVKTAKQYIFLNAYLWKRPKRGQSPKRVPYRSERQDLIFCAHDQLGHFGIKGVYDRLQREFFWFGMYTDVVNHISTCLACQQFERRKIQFPLLPIPVHHVFEIFGVDIVGPIAPPSRRGHKYLLVFVEYATRWPSAIPLEDVSALTITRALYAHLFAVYGPPQQLITDNAKYFVADGITSFIKFLGTQHKLTPAYTPRVNGLCEKTNDLVTSGLKKTLTHLATLLQSGFEDWDLSVPAVLYALRTKISGSLQATPFELLYGCRPPSLSALTHLGDFIVNPPDATTRRVQALARLADQQHYLASLVNANRTWPTYAEHDLVLVKRLRVATSKFQPKWLGPYKVRCRIGLSTYQLMSISGQLLDGFYPVDRLKRYRLRGGEVFRQSRNTVAVGEDKQLTRHGDPVGGDIDRSSHAGQ
jgi:hypothetical protein